MLIGTDFSDASLWAVQEAAGYAQLLDYDIDLVHVIDPGAHTPDSLPDHYDVEERLQSLAGDLEKSTTVKIATDVYEQSPGKTLAKVSQHEKYAMVAVGYSGKSGVLSRIGSIASQVVRLVDKPILVPVPNRHPRGPIIGCIDFSSQSEKVNHWTNCLAAVREEKAILTHVAAPYEVLIAGTPSLGGIPMVNTVIENLGGSESEYRSRLENSVRTRLGLEPNIDVEILLNNSPSKAIGNFAETQQASLVIVGRHGHNTLGARIIGSTAEHVIGLSHCSALVIP